MARSNLMPVLRHIAPSDGHQKQLCSKTISHRGSLPQSCSVLYILHFAECGFKNKIVTVPFNNMQNLKFKLKGCVQQARK